MPGVVEHKAAGQATRQNKSKKAHTPTHADHNFSAAAIDRLLACGIMYIYICIAVRCAGV